MRIQISYRFQINIVIDSSDKIGQKILGSWPKDEDVLDVLLPQDYMAEVHRQVLRCKNVPLPPLQVQVGKRGGTRSPHGHPLHLEVVGAIIKCIVCQNKLQ